MHRYQILPGILKEYLEKVIGEQKKKALARLSWHYVDEISRPDTLNKSYAKLVADANIPGIGKDLRSTTEAYNKNLEMYFQFAEARYVDNVVRTITTHIFDVPLNDSLLRTAVKEHFTYVFQATEIEKGHKMEDLMKIRDDLEKERNKAEGKISELESLREALREHESYDWGRGGGMGVNGYAVWTSENIPGPETGADQWKHGQQTQNFQAQQGNDRAVAEGFLGRMQGSQVVGQGFQAPRTAQGGHAPRAAQGVQAPRPAQGVHAPTAAQRFQALRPAQGVQDPRTAQGDEPNVSRSTAEPVHTGTIPPQLTERYPQRY